MTIFDVGVRSFVSASDPSDSLFFWIFVRYTLKLSSHVSSSYASLYHSWNLPSFPSLGRTVLSVVKNFFFMMFEDVLFFLGNVSMFP